MVAALRLSAFLTGAIGLELFRGIGAAALAAALLLGVTRRSPVALVVLIALGTGLSLALFDQADASGKISHGLSNAPFVALLYVILVVSGYGIGRLVRALRT
jgi:hypothetical protein